MFINSPSRKADVRPMTQRAWGALLGVAVPAFATVLLLTASSGPSAPMTKPPPMPDQMHPSEVVPVLGSDGEVLGVVSADALGLSPETRVSLQAPEPATVGQSDGAEAATPGDPGIPFAPVSEPRHDASDSSIVQERARARLLTTVQYAQAISQVRDGYIRIFSCWAPAPADDRQLELLASGKTWIAVDGQVAGPMPDMCGPAAVRERPAPSTVGDAYVEGGN